jgi:hypothetical protein
MPRPKVEPPEPTEPCRTVVVNVVPASFDYGRSWLDDFFHRAFESVGRVEAYDKWRVRPTFSQYFSVVFSKPEEAQRAVQLFNAMKIADTTVLMFVSWPNRPENSGMWTIKRGRVLY